MTINKSDGLGICEAGMEYMPLKIKPRPDCEFCQGTGEVSDSVPYGMGSTSMESYCDCIMEQLPEGREDDDFDIDLSDYRTGD